MDINQNILDRDKSLKLELDLANSLNSDMVLRLAMSQRQIKQLSDKISRLESAENDKQQTQIQQLNEKVCTQQSLLLYHQTTVILIYISG